MDSTNVRTCFAGHPCGKQTIHSDGEKTELAACQPVLRNQVDQEAKDFCTKNGICSHEVLRNGENNLALNGVNNKIMRKVIPFP